MPAATTRARTEAGWVVAGIVTTALLPVLCVVALALPTPAQVMPVVVLVLVYLQPMLAVITAIGGVLTPRNYARLPVEERGPIRVQLLVVGVVGVLAGAVPGMLVCLVCGVGMHL